MFHTLQQGGVFMVPLLIASIWALTIALERLFYFATIEGGSPAFREKLRQLASGRQIEQAIQWLVGQKGPVASHSLSAFKNWNQSDPIFEETLLAQSQIEEVELHRNLTVLETITTASPLIGLLGTITGMMGVFRAVSEKLAQNPQADTSHILAGIGEALIATATGIVVAVVALLAHNLFLAQAEKTMATCQQVVNELSLIRRHEKEQK